MSTQKHEESLPPPNLPLYEILRNGMEKIPPSVSLIQMRKYIVSKFIGFRSDRENCIVLNEIAFVVILRYYHSRHRNCTQEELREELRDLYSVKITSKGAVFKLIEIPDRLTRIIYVLADTIKN